MDTDFHWKKDFENQVVNKQDMKQLKNSENLQTRFCGISGFLHDITGSWNQKCHRICFLDSLPFLKSVKKYGNLKTGFLGISGFELPVLCKALKLKLETLTSHGPVLAVDQVPEVGPACFRAFLADIKNGGNRGSDAQEYFLVDITKVKLAGFKVRVTSFVKSFTVNIF